MRALFLGDSFTAPLTPSRGITGYTGPQTASGFYVDAVCQGRGWRRVNGEPDAPFAAAIGGTCLAANTGQPSLMPFAAQVAFNLRVAAHAPDWLVVLLGVNDYYYCVGADVWSAAWQSVARQVAEMPTTPRVVVCTLPLLLAQPNSAQAGMMDAATVGCALQHNYLVVNFAGMTAAMVGPDGIHPNAAGHQFIATRILTTLGAP
jgi:lysophospholipase L1-like esterase